ncbi:MULTISPECIES: HAD family hydrolase [Microbacterium]|uniref:HAD family hydrolase n=1 Tax=Microbacterium wangchenii TaxID=2541726 RepID=A0ABX5SSJ0_9MICO|nr:MULTISPECIES: HAD family hydrolase [Microbacterium]MCK6065728.1 HAD family hydrolase [Microbacterium sp. EYE_512]QBR89133.1 HAD family hydrolase [Microbacterium wangchenii]TXK08994.1 HAD family hydrolase [Microbacterium wangchenii]
MAYFSPVVLAGFSTVADRGLSSFEEQRRRRLLTLLPTLGIEFDDSASSLDALFARYLAAYRSAWRPFPDVVEVLESLRSRGFRIGVLTNGNEEQQLAKLKAIGVEDIIDAVCISEAIGVQKPDARAFEALAVRLDIAPAECLFIGDNPRQDVVGARAAGMRATQIERYRDGAPHLAAVIGAALDLAKT